MSKIMMINTIADQECRIAIVQDGVLEELYIERASNASHVGNIYKAKITNVEPSIQAAFVDYGATKNGFLHISDLHPQYFPRGKNSANEPVGKKRRHRDRPPIQACLRRGQEIIVQMTKEGIGTKGPTMTTYPSIAGRQLVMMPGMSKTGISRKIEDESVRDRARKILADLNPPKDMGFIIRTAGMESPKKDLQRDLNYLLRLWRSVKQKAKQSKAPAEIYQESDLITRTIRDIYNSDIERIICDDESVARRVKDFLDVAVPRTDHKIEIYTGKEGLFYDFGIEDEIEKIYARRVELKGGGSIVIDQAEALVAIDVNSGKYREHSDAESTARQTDLQAVDEIARQLRLRDMGGVIVIDFIDLRNDRDRREVEKALREAVKNDRAKTKILKMSAFGIVEMTRQRMRPSLKDSISRPCEHCMGLGRIKSDESLALIATRNIQRACANADVAKVEIIVAPSVANYLANQSRDQIARMETLTCKKIVVLADPAAKGEDIKITCTNNRGSVVTWHAPIKSPKGQSHPLTIPLAYTPQPQNLDDIADDEPVEGFDFSEGNDEYDVEDRRHAGETHAEPAANEPASVAAVAQPAAETIEPRPQEAGANADQQTAMGQSPQQQQKQQVSSAGRQQQEGQPSEQKRGRRRGRRGGRKHRKQNQQNETSGQQPKPQAQSQKHADTPSSDTTPPTGDNAQKQYPPKDTATQPPNMGDLPDIFMQAISEVRAERAAAQTGPATQENASAATEQTAQSAKRKKPRRVWFGKRKNNLLNQAKTAPAPE